MFVKVVRIWIWSICVLLFHACSSEKTPLTIYAIGDSTMAEKMDVQLIDLQKITEEWVNSLGDKASEKIYVWTAPSEKYPEGRKDDTHLSEKGADHIAIMVLDECISKDVPIADRIRDR